MSLHQNPRPIAHGYNWFSYQSECHCTKTERSRSWEYQCLVTSQNVTAPKPKLCDTLRIFSLVTSQNVTAPKPMMRPRWHAAGLVTSQNVTAPKHSLVSFMFYPRLVTSQNVTAPKPLSQNLPCKETSIPTGSEIISEQSSRSTTCLFSLLFSWINFSVSIRRICIPRKMA